MVADFSKPLLTQSSDDIIQQLKLNIDSLAKMDLFNSSNVPVGSIAYVAEGASGKFKRKIGPSQWEELPLIINFDQLFSSYIQAESILVQDGNGSFEGGTPQKVTIEGGDVIADGDVLGQNISNIEATIASMSGARQLQLGTAPTAAKDLNIDLSTNSSYSIINIPDASSDTRGVLTASAQTIGGTKTLSTGKLILGDHTDPEYNWYFTSKENSDKTLRLYNASNDLDPLVTINYGRVGIRESSPATKLHIGGSGDHITVGTRNRPGFNDNAIRISADTQNDYGTGHLVTFIGNKGIVGTESSHDLIFLTNSLPRLVITANGNVGVGGIEAPESTLHINGTLKINTFLSDSAIVLTKSGASTNILKTTSQTIIGSNNLVINDSGGVGIGTGYDPTLYGKLAVHTSATASSTQKVLAMVNDSAVDNARLRIAGYYSTTNTVQTAIDFVQNALNNLQSKIIFSTHNGSSIQERVIIDSSGNVGVGTTSPAATLHVASLKTAPSTASIKVSANSTSGAGTNEASIDLAITGVSGAEVSQKIKSVYNSGYELQTQYQDRVAWRNQTSETMCLNSSGFLGIGTTTPTEKLHVSGVLRLDGAAAPAPDSGTRFWMEGGFGTRYDGYGHRFDVCNGTTRTEALRITNIGWVGIGTASPQSFLHLSRSNNDVQIILETTGGNSQYDQSIQFKDAGSTWFVGNRYITGNEHSFGVGRTTSKDDFVISSTGNIGIGTTTPSEKLHVSANARIEGNLTAVGSLIINNPSPTIYFQDSDNRSAMIHCNSNILHFLRGSGTTNSLAWGTVNGYWPLTLNLETNEARFGGDVWTAGGVGVSGNLATDDVTSWTDLIFNIPNTANRYKFPNIYRGGGASGNANISSDGALFVPSSSIRYKKDIETLNSEFADNVLKLRPVFYRPKESNGDPDYYSWYGLIAEEVHDIEPRLTYESYTDESWEETLDETTGQIKKTLKPNAQRRPEGVVYDRIGVLLIDVVKRQRDKIQSLEERILALEKLLLNG